MSINKGIDQKLNVKPCYLQLIHRYAYEGPCRSGYGDQLTTEFDEKSGRENFKNYQKALDALGLNDVNMLEPVYLTWTDEFIFKEEQIKKMTKDLDDIDLFLINGHLSQYLAAEIGVRFKKPVGVIGCCTSTDATAGLRAKGLEAYGYIDMNHALNQIPLLRVKKAIRNTNVLVVLKNDIISKGVISTITDLESIKNELGVRFTFINLEDLFTALRSINEGQKKEAMRITDELLENATKNTMRKEYVQKSVESFIVVKALLDKYECNAFTMPCFEACATRKFNDEFQITPCLIHSLLKEEGIPSACEADINVLMALNVLINLTKKAPHLGNVHPLTDLDVIPEVQGRENIVTIHHAVATRKMKGIANANSPYSIQSFTNSGWGTTLRYDFNQDQGEVITLLRFHPTGKKMYAVKGKIIVGTGLDEIGCMTGFCFEVANTKDFYSKQLEFGHHFAWVYGDYMEELKDLGQILNLEVVTA